MTAGGSSGKTRKPGFVARMTKFIAFAVDAPEGRYDLIADEAAAQEARQYLEQHRIIEVWSDDHRRVARIARQSG
jgi:hypothetical protein